MKISRKVWTDYVDKLRAINDKAADAMWAWLKTHSIDDVEEMLDYAFQLVSRYGEASAALAAEMYDVTAEMAGKFVPAAIPAEISTYSEVAEAINGSAKYSNPKTVASAVGRLTKMAGVDTVMHNAIRDGAKWAWVPMGETCAFCLTLASRGWQPASKKALSKGHARHIHANCNCIYAVSFDDDPQLEGYDPDEYYDIYKNAEGNNSQDRINSIRRRLYAENHYEIRTQQREAYHLRREREKENS